MPQPVHTSKSLLPHIKIRIIGAKMQNISSTAQGGGGSLKKRKTEKENYRRNWFLREQKH